MVKNVGLLSSVKNEQRIEILRKTWISHDARWQMAVFQEYGWEKGNKLNREVIRDIGKGMMYRLMKALEISKVNNIEELQAICSVAMDLYYPPPNFAYHFERLSDTSLLGVIKSCGSYENVKKAGVLDHYECGCFAMRSGWYAALGVEVQEELGKCLKKGDNICEIFLRVNKWKEEKPTNTS
nr:hypothetical protein [Candidatus Freyarchaeota archaeon]